MYYIGEYRGMAREPRPQLIFRPNLGPRGRKHLFETGPPPYLRVWMTTPHPPLSPDYSSSFEFLTFNCSKYFSQYKKAY